MKISKLIKQLKDIKKLHGDIEVFCWPYDGQSIKFTPDLIVKYAESGNSLEIDRI